MPRYQQCQMKYFVKFGTQFKKKQREILICCQFIEQIKILLMVHIDLKYSFHTYPIKKVVASDQINLQKFLTTVKGQTRLVNYILNQLDQEVQESKINKLKKNLKTTQQLYFNFSLRDHHLAIFKLLIYNKAEVKQTIQSYNMSSKFNNIIKSQYTSKFQLEIGILQYKLDIFNKIQYDQQNEKKQLNISHILVLLLVTQNWLFRQSWSHINYNEILLLFQSSFNIVSPFYIRRTSRYFQNVNSFKSSNHGIYQFIVFKLSKVQTLRCRTIICLDINGNSITNQNCTKEMSLLSGFVILSITVFLIDRISYFTKRKIEWYDTKLVNERFSQKSFKLWQSMQIIMNIDCSLIKGIYQIYGLPTETTSIIQ
ncbi:unnamed protein product [Paramecium primaurelia]|uniref:Transmembrane protein n=1 Tax=Paramecium primaurelia TaxID=5886 RepID=A0A8S1QNP8_PARPR|nr:unnamed protein product [Paramecium primaurelia]